MKRTKRPLRVLIAPRTELREGVQLCFRIASERLDEAAVLIDSGDRFATLAAVVFTFALEEFGKAVLLHSAYERQQDDAVTVVGFYDHQTKLEAAAEHIPENFLMINTVPVAIGSPPRMRTVFFGGSVNVDDRFDALYVDWETSKWKVGLPVDPVLLKRNIKGARLAIDGTGETWRKYGYGTGTDTHGTGQR